MVSNMNIEQIEELEEEQKKLRNKIPFKVKYKKDYLWQIYYSEDTNKYFMLVPTEDLDKSAFFYVLKKQLQNKNEKIFVPISYMDYTREYLTTTQISDIENYLWLFTKEWPLVYEVFDKNNNVSIHIVGKANIYDDIKSDYKIELKNNEDSLKFYKLLKALFIMQTEISRHFKFYVSIDKKGGIVFNINNKKVIYEILPSLIKEEYLKAEDERINLTDKKIELEKELDDLQKKSSTIEKEYIEKEKQIAIFLEYKKTFFGRVKYFLKYKKVKLSKKDETEENKQDVKLIRLNKYGDVKNNYTIEELIETYKQVDKEEIKVKNLDSDIKALKQRIINLSNKVKNATLYIEEIDSHKKSIFDFWKFTNKDKQAELPEGEMTEEKRDKIKKTFDYELDFEDFGINFDKKQREALNKKELDSIYLTTTDIIEDINKILKEEKITKDRLEILKKKAMKEKKLLEKDSFDIFGGASYDNKLNTLANKKHRETPKDIFNILPITKYTTLNEYEEILKDVINNLENAYEKIKIGITMPIYNVTDSETLDEGYDIFNIQAADAIEIAINNEDEKNINLIKVTLNENTKVLGFTNSVFYDNTNKTLPLGMDVEGEFLLNNKKIDLDLKEQKKINIVCFENEKDDFSKINIKQINVKEYAIIDKN